MRRLRGTVHETAVLQRVREDMMEREREGKRKQMGAL
jgi:hypothetical protein